MRGAVVGGVAGGLVGNNINSFIPGATVFKKKTAEGIVGGTVLGGVIGALIGYAEDQKARADQAVGAGTGE